MKGENMSKKTCKDCLNCSIEDTNEVYCSGMPWHYPFGGSDTVSLDKEACEYFLERREPTVFDRITASPDVLVESLVFWEGGWTSRFIKFTTTNREEAIAATLEELNKVSK